MKECILDVEMMHKPYMIGGNAENDVYGGGFDDRTESLIEVNTGLPREATNNPTCLVILFRLF
jgi:hypothetical protein